MSEFVIHPLAVGINETDQGIMTYQQGYGQRIWLPIYAFYLSGGGRRILVDTGLEEFLVPERAEAELGYPILEFEAALAGLGLEPGDIDLVIQTHLHNDHCENTYKCTKARVLVQRAEYEFCLDPHPLDHRYFPDLLEGLDLEIIEGDREIEPGLSVILTPGHTPGGQSVALDTAAGKAVITGFCANQKNFPPGRPVVASGVHTDAIAAWESAQKVRQMADLILPLHDVTLGARKEIPG